MPVLRRRRHLAIVATLGVLAGLLPSPAWAAAPSLSTTQIVASGLTNPWDIGFLPDGTMLVTERPGRVRVYNGGISGLSLQRTINISNVHQVGESGLMGIAVDVNFTGNRYVYVCATRNAGGIYNQILRFTVDGSGNWVSGKVLVGTMTASNIHNGCALEMDRFGYLWATMGDANNTALAQNRNSYNGKVLRMTRDGGVPGDNPVIGGTRNLVYSMGHRNPQGITFRPGTDQVYVAEHGPTTDDEINLIQAGGNYGWPCFTGSSDPWTAIAGCGPAGNYIEPLWESNSPTLATSGIAFSSGSQWQDYDDQLWVTTLKEADIRRFGLNGAGNSLTNPSTHFDGSWGRLRGIVYGPGGQLYVTTSNGGTGDKVVRIRPTTPSVGRIAGPNRYSTAANLALDAFPGGATAVMIGTGLDFPDALAGGAAGGNFGYPVLLTLPDSIPAPTLNAVDALNPQTIYVLGGPSVVSDAVAAQLAPYATSGNVIRLSGADRYATAADVSQEFFSPGVPAAFVAVGTNYADALAGGPAAAFMDGPLLLTKSSSLPPATANELDRLNPQRIYVLGSSGVINNAVYNLIDAYTAGPTKRLAGSDRYATAAAISREFWLRSSAYVTTGQNFPDALGGGAVAGHQGVPMLLSMSTAVPLATGNEVLRLGAPRLTMLGSTGALSSGVENNLKRLVGTP